MRTAVLINGGAAVSVLAFIGHFVTQGRSIAQIADVASSLISFAWGVVAAGVAMGFTYFSAYSGTKSLSDHATKWQHPYVSPGRRTHLWEFASTTFTICAIAAGLASLALFIYGMFDVRDSIIRLGR
jgi:hypothetical protein